LPWFHQIALLKAQSSQIPRQTGSERSNSYIAGARYRSADASDDDPLLQLDVSQNVVTFTQSGFGRTLTSNGDGRITRGAACSS
jgi:uncharacterized protein (DUF1501 family)